MLTAPPRVTRVALVGLGYWGINHVRVMASQPRAQITWLCDPSLAARDRAAGFAPTACLTGSFDDLLAADDVDAIVLATPAVLHADMATRALAADKHVFVEKPLAMSVEDAAKVRDAARHAERVLLVGHLMLYHPVINRVKELLNSGALGRLLYLYSSRVNLGRVRQDENALWSLAPHDISLIDYLLAQMPVSVTARGSSYLQDGIQDVVFVNLAFADGQMANVHLSWLDPRKERRLTMVCSKKMVEFDDVAVEKLRIYDKGYDRPPSFTQFGEYLTIRQGDLHVPHVQMSEPLVLEMRHFLDCIENGAQPITDVDSGVRVVKVLTAAQRSLERDGQPITIAP